MTDQARPRSQHAQKLQDLIDKERYKSLVHRAAKQLRNRGVPRSAVDPEDVVHTALESVLAVARPIHNVRSYLYTCVDNEIKRAARRYAEGRGYASLDADVRLQDELAVQPIAHTELNLIVAQAFGDLPLQQRRVMLLTQDLGMTQAQAAQLLGIAQATVGVHARRAVQALRIALVGLGTALVAWTTWSMVSGVRNIIPAAGLQPPVAPTVARSLFITIGLVSVLLGLTICTPNQLIRPLWRQLLQWLAARRAAEKPSQENHTASASPSSSSGRAENVDPADQWVLNQKTGEYELRLTPSQQPAQAPSSRSDTTHRARPVASTGSRRSPGNVAGPPRRSNGNRR